MKIDLKTYFEEREKQKIATLIPGPVITFSREYGCEANKLSAMLIHRINEHQPLLKRQPWSIINKEILDEAAKILGISVQEIDQQILLHHSGLVNEIFSPYKHHYNVTDRIILEKVQEVMMTYARRGNIIMIGRGGSIVTQKFPNSIHVRLIASLEWRAKRIAQKQGIKYDEAIEVVEHFDKTRTLWMEHLSGKKYHKSIFDLTLNVETLTDEEVVEVILRLMQIKKMIGERKLSKIEAEPVPV